MSKIKLIPKHKIGYTLDYDPKILIMFTITERK